jgi:four helix bundle protein
MYMGNFKDLHTWRLSLDVAKSVYRVTDSFPDKEKFGLVSQMRRAAVSVMSNIAEGSRRRDKDQLYFLRIAQGSAAELESQLILSQEIGFLHQQNNKIFDELDHLGRVLHLYYTKLGDRLNVPVGQVH